MDNARENYFSLVSSPLMYELGEAIVQNLDRRGLRIQHQRLAYTTFANDELLPQIPEPIRGQHVFFLHALQHPDPNTAVVAMLLAMDAMRRASVDGITIVTPYLPYLRQDRKDQPRVPISARLLADLIEANRSVKQLITIDMHTEQEQGFFSIPVDNLTGVRIFSEYLRSRFGNDFKNTIAVAADFGATTRTRRLATALGDIPVARFEKRRLAPNKAEIVSGIGESINIVGSRILIYEDIIDSGETMRKTIQTLKDMGVSEIVVYATHGIFSGESEKRFAADNLSVACTDSIPRTAEYYRQQRWLVKVSIASYLAEAIGQATKMGGSISRLSP